MNLEHVMIEAQEARASFVEHFSDMHMHDLLRYSRSRNLQYLEWVDMVSLVHELADRLETEYVNAVDKEGRSP